jgi:hypothetical protein
MTVHFKELKVSVIEIEPGQEVLEPFTWKYNALVCDSVFLEAPLFRLSSPF